MKLSKREVAEMPPIKYQAQVIAWSRGRDEPTADDLKEAERLVSCWNKIRIARNQKPLI